MAIPLLALAFGAGIGLQLHRKGKERERERMQLGEMRAGLDSAVSAGMESGLLSMEQGQILTPFIDADPEEAADLLQDMLVRNHQTRQGALDRKVDWYKADQADQRLAFDQDRLAFDQQKFEREADAGFQRRMAMARDTKNELVFDALTGTEHVVPAPGTDAWQEAVTDQQLAAQATQVYNAYAASIAEAGGIIFDPAQEGYGQQQELRTRLALAIKEATNAGALDQGLLDTVERLTGTSVGNRDYLLGNDANAMERVMSLGGMFGQQLQRSARTTRLYSGIDPQLVRQSQSAAQNLQAVGAALQQRIGAARAMGGETRVPVPVEELTYQEQIEAMRTGNWPTQRRSTPAETTRAGMSVMGENLSDLVSGLLGFAVGRGVR